MWNEKFDPKICTAPKGHMGTYTGAYIAPLHVDPKTIDIVDIAHALSLACRWTGHCKYHYSVGLHSLVVARLVYELGQSPPVVRQGLLHDGSEAILNDVSSPVKYDPEMGAYRRAEHRLETLINEKFGCPYPVKNDCPSVAWADFVALCIEGRDLFTYQREPEVFGVRTWPDIRLAEVVGRIFFPPVAARTVNESFLLHLSMNHPWVERRFLEVFHNGFEV